VTTIAYQIVKKALLKKRAEVTASPAAAKKFLVESGLWDVLEDAPIDPKRRKAVATAVKKSGAKKIA
jgi:hypothetical protein